jgi:molybdopterin-guanine dinucleotide biosynthesis protein A
MTEVTSPRAVSFSAVLLAGGASKRMGQDKALLSVNGEPLWQRQWRLLESLRPQEIFWSGPARLQSPAHAHFVVDEFPGAGPLAGISACLDILRSDLLLVLAIDLVQMSDTFLRDLLRSRLPEVGVVPQRGDFFEPLAAIYPKALAGLARDHLVQGRHAMQDFIREAVRMKKLQTISVTEMDSALFRNLNEPEDLTGLPQISD